MYPSVGVAAHGVASCDSAGEGCGVSNHNPRESRCDLYLRWNCIGTSDTTNDHWDSTMYLAIYCVWWMSRIPEQL